jgi:hypothetical protein
VLERAVRAPLGNRAACEQAARFPQIQMRSPMEDRDMNTNKHHEGWELRESGPAGADHAVLLLAGALVTAAYCDDVLAEPRLKEASVRFVAATMPAHGGTQPPDDLSVDNYARLAGKLATDFRCDAVVSHNLGANVAIEMLAAGHFSGPLVLLAPSFSRRGRVQVSAHA